MAGLARSTALSPFHIKATQHAPAPIIRWRSSQEQQRYLPPLQAVQPRAQPASHDHNYTHEPYFDDIAWDVDKEKSRAYRRTTFNFSDWKRHRSTFRHLRHVKTTFESRIVHAVLQPVMYVVGLSLAVATYQTLLPMGLLPAWMPALPTIPLEPLSIISFALSLLLVFRTNSSYARWDEGRRRFGCISTTCRDLGRQCLSFFRDATSKATMMCWMVAFARSCVVHLREEGDLRAELQDLLEPEEAQAVVMSDLVSSSNVDPVAIERMDFNMSLLVDALTACDRILNTPIPLSYTRHTSRFLLIWLLLLPFSLWALCGWSMVPLTALTAFVLFGIEEIGVQIEEPFSVLALEQLCTSMEQCLIGMCQTQDQVAAVLLAARSMAGQGPGSANGNGSGIEGTVYGNTGTRSIYSNSGGNGSNGWYGAAAAAAGGAA